MKSARLLGLDNPSDDAVFDAAIRRAGMLRVFTTDEMFDALETLAYAMPPIRGDRLAIISNGIGPAVLAADDLIVGEGQLAKLLEETFTKLTAILPPSRSQANPVQLVGNSAEPL